jgi:hypothetical protein
MHSKTITAGGLVRIAAGVGLLLLAAGCNSRGSISGKVLYKGKPMPGGKVLFIHEKKGAFSALIHPDGTYSFTDIPTGQVKIAVASPRSPSDEADDPRFHLMKKPKEQAELMAKIKKSMPAEIDEEAMRDMMGIRKPKPKSAPPTLVLPRDLGDPEKSGLRWTVEGGSQTHDIELQ